MTVCLKVLRNDIEKNDNIKLFDRDEDYNLDMFHYITCNDEDNELIKRCRGVVFNGEKLVMNGFPYTVEMSNKNINDIHKYIDSNEFKNCKVFKSHEGTLIRMFYFNNKWFMTTHRKLDAFKSKWASKESFGTYFKKALEQELISNENLKKNFPSGDKSNLEKFQSLLDTSKQYMFLVLNDNFNRIVCEPPGQPTVFHVGTFIDGVLSLTEDVYIPKPEEITFNSIEDMCDYVNYIEPLEFQGVIIFTPNNRQYKITNSKYRQLFNVRGNEPSIKFRYLQVRMFSEQVDMLYYLYPDMIPTFEKYEEILKSKAKEIHSNYILRFIKKLHVVVPKEEFQIIKACHSWYLENRDDNKVIFSKVLEKMNMASPVTLNRIIRNELLKIRDDKYK